MHDLIDQAGRRVPIRTVLPIERLNNLAALAKSSPEDGACAELGVYLGGSLLLIGECVTPRIVYGFDTFAGLPKADHSNGELHQPGNFDDTSFEHVSEYVMEYPNIRLVKGYFPSTLTEEHKRLRYSFVHIDSDYRKSVAAAIEFFWPRMVNGGIMVFDDYSDPMCPGVKSAIMDAKLACNDLGTQAYVVKEI